jgi:hypothetical protein
LKPQVGRIVHYVLYNGEIRPAIIVRVWGDEMVNLRVFFDGSNDAGEESYGTEWRTSVHYAEPVDGATEFETHTWFWPPRV